MTMNRLLQAALDYASRGWRVFPLQGKRPFPGTHGFKDATTDTLTIRRWWRQHPDANIGVVTGRISGIVVVDIDGPEGEAALAEFGPLPATPTARTGRGRHLYYSYPPDRTIRRHIRVRPGLDVLGDGGYVVAPPSIHPETGRRYRWTHAPR